MRTTPVTRIDFIRGLMDAGLPYDHAARAYSSVMSTIANGIVNGQKVGLGSIGCLYPTVAPARQVRMTFDRTGGKITRRTREFSLDSRLRFKFRLFKKFSQTHELKWFGETCS